jgi:hypothetical protein
VAARVGVDKGKVAERLEERRRSLAREQEMWACHEEVEDFVAKLKGFHDSLDPAEQAMLGTILDGATAADTGGYYTRIKFGQQGGQKPWEDFVGWIASQGEEDTQGFGMRMR